MYVHATDTPGLAALRAAGAWPWPRPADAEGLAGLLTSAVPPVPGEPPQAGATAPAGEPSPASVPIAMRLMVDPGASGIAPPSVAEELFSTVRTLILRDPRPRTDVDVAAELGVDQAQARKWLTQMVAEGALERSGQRPARYRPQAAGPRQMDLLD